MNIQPSVSELYSTAARLSPRDFLRLLKKLTVLQFKRKGVNVLPDKEATLLQELNQGFPAEKWARLRELDHKLEFGKLNEKEDAEFLQLAEEYEHASIRRLKILAQLAEIRNVSIDTLSNQLGIKPKFHA